MTFSDIFLRESFKNGTVTHTDVNEWYFNRGPLGTTDNSMKMINESRTDLVRKFLMYNTSNYQCAVVKVETWTEDGLPLLAKDIKDENQNAATGAFTLTVYYDLSVTDPNKEVPTDCIDKYNEYVRTGNKTIYTKDCQTSSGKTD
nr:uncharacterized protein LOC129385359 [Dermacentor andersoni]